MLTGADLLAKVKELGEVNKTDLVRACGYVSLKKDGSERLNFTAFYEALLEAKGVEVGGSKASRGRAGRKLSYRTKVQFNGNLLIGKAYTALLDLEPGDEFEIKLGRKSVRLIPSDSECDESESNNNPSEEDVNAVFGVVPDSSDVDALSEFAVI
jgi:hypothetical protein